MTTDTGNTMAAADAANGIKVAFVFPGQGSQAVGMGRDWADAFPAARRTFEEADEALGFALSQLCWEGPEDELRLTQNTQPAILASSVAILRAAGGSLPQPEVVAGHSLGEYSALVAAGTLTLGDALRLVRHRGRFMQEAVPVGEGAMAAILGPDAAAVEEVAKDASSEDEICVAANYNAPAQTVIAGQAAAVERAVELAKERGARRAVLLPVSAPFHSPLMAPARARLEPLLAETAFSDPAIPIVTNVDARAVTTGDEARSALVRQVDGPVRWVESVRSMLDGDGVSVFVEIGPGAVLSGLVRRIERAARSVSLAEPKALDALEAALEGETS